MWGLGFTDSQNYLTWPWRMAAAMDVMWQFLTILNDCFWSLQQNSCSVKVTEWELTLDRNIHVSSGYHEAGNLHVTAQVSSSCCGTGVVGVRDSNVFRVRALVTFYHGRCFLGWACFGG